MHLRQDRKWKTEVITEDTTFSEALPSAGLLAAIMLRVRVKNASPMYSINKNWIHDHLTKLVVKADGVESFKDIWGPTCVAEWMLEYGRLPPGFADHRSSGYQTECFPIMFGRRWGDPEFALDLSKFGETRLEITNDFSTTYIEATKNIWFDIDLHFLVNTPTPPNMLATSQISSHTWTAVSQEHTFKVPTKRKVRRILLGADSYPSDGTGSPSYKHHRVLRYLKYYYETKGIILKDDDFFRDDQDSLWGFPDYAKVSWLASTYADDTYAVDTLLTRPVKGLATVRYSTDPGDTQPTAIDQRMERFWMLRAIPGVPVQLDAEGYGPLSHLCLHEDKPDNLAGYLDPKLKADVEAVVGNSSSGSAGGTIRFITQHVRPNA